MKAILIDPKGSVIKGIELEHEIRTAFSTTGDVPVALMAYVLDANNMLFVDDNAVLRDHPAPFWVSGFYRPIFGRGVIIGVNASGHQGTTLAQRQVEARVRWAPTW